MAKTQSNPFRGFLDVMSEMDRMRNLGKGGSESAQETEARTHATAWWPTSDIVARGNDMVISAELPGVPPRDIDISVSDGVLTISGERRREPDDVAAAPYLRERCYGQFRRSMILPDAVDEHRITATFGNGVVTITVADGAVAAVAARPHRIPLLERDDT